MKRGSIYWVSLEPSEPPEFGKLRPCIVVSGTSQNLVLSTVVVVPLSTQEPEIWPLRVAVKIPKIKTSFAVVPGIRQVSKMRFKEQIGSLNSSQLRSLDEALQLYLSD